MSDERGRTYGVSREDASKAAMAVAEGMVRAADDPVVRRMVEKFGRETTVNLLAGVKIDSQALGFDNKRLGS